jgi:NAD-dependent dihydropyrimidine dehydrogenase PreA subunit
MALRIDPEKCTACMACIEVCHAGAIDEPLKYGCSRCVKYCLEIEVPCTPAALCIREDLCDGCGRCVVACKAGAIGEVQAGL